MKGFISLSPVAMMSLVGVRCAASVHQSGRRTSRIFPRSLSSSGPARSSRDSTTLLRQPPPRIDPDAELPLEGLAVNYHFTRKCNMACTFCFHTDKSSHVLSNSDALKLLTMLREAGASKINFAGGEPFLPGYQPRLGSMVKHSRKIGFEAVSVITNGSMLKRPWFVEFGESLTMLGVSCDSVDEDTNVALGRTIQGSASSSSSKGPVKSSSSKPSKSLDRASTVQNAAELCSEFKIDFKVNTVVCSANFNEDMSALIAGLLPSPLTRWKIFQVLPLGGENTGNTANGKLRDVRPLLVSGEAFAAYVDRARAGLRRLAPPGVSDTDSLVKIEDNEVMQDSYILIDEFGRLLDCSTGEKRPTGKSVLEVGVREALRGLVASPGGGFDADAFVKRDGQYYRNAVPPVV